MSSFVNETQFHSYLHSFTNLLPLSIHSHIQRPILAEGEASFSLIHLHWGTASIQQNSINAAWPNIHIRQQGLQLAESAKDWFDTTTGERIRKMAQWGICILMHMEQLLWNYRPCIDGTGQEIFLHFAAIHFFKLKLPLTHLTKF